MRFLLLPFFMAALLPGLPARRLTNDPALQIHSLMENPEEILRFDPGSAPSAGDAVKIGAGDLYNDEKGYGILPSGDMPVAIDRGGSGPGRDFLTGSHPFSLALKLPEGKYEVCLTLGDPGGSSETTVKAESRRLMLENVKTRKGRLVTKKIVVDVRTPRIHPTGEIRRKERELDYLNWDDKLTLEFAGRRPCIAYLEIKKTTDLPVIYLAGNSTVTDQEREPWASWGQMLPRFLKPEVAVANYAESGESLLSFKREKRLEKILSIIKPGDWLFVEFAHNDQKPGGNHVNAFTTYKEELKFFIGAARNKGAQPVLVTSMHRRRFDDNGKIINTLEDYPEAMCQTAREENVPCIDLNGMSKILFEALGPEESKKAFVHFPPNSFPGQTEPLADDTHFSNYGAYLLARCVVESIRREIPVLSRFLLPAIRPFNPARPLPFNRFRVPASGMYAPGKPEGS